MNKMYQLST